MLQSLRINNFALIDSVELSFNKGYSVITGETGSGKSILLGALNLILGERADFSAIGPNGDKAFVEAEFDLSGFQKEDFFRNNDLDFSQSVLIRREINKLGKSRAFINDTPVQLNVLRDLTASLVNIHSQYNTLELKSKSYQLQILDTLADLTEERLDFQRSYSEYKDKVHHLNQLNTELSNLLQQQDYNRFQLDELEGLKLEDIDFGQLESELKLVENAELLKQTLGNLVDGIDAENQIMDLLRSLRSMLDKLSGINSEIDDLAQRINTVMIELSDVSSDAERYADSIDVNPSRIDQLISVLDKYNHALRKHNVHDQQALLEIKVKLENSVANTEELHLEIIRLTEEVNRLKEILKSRSEELHSAREKSIEPIVQSIGSILSELKLPHTKLDFKLTKREELNSTGCTEIQMLFSANVGMETVSIERAASGGELSRVMLALQKMISEKTLLPTVLFDEIDTGVSGDVAEKIGLLLRKMGDHFQLMAISHLPQVAAKASTHFKVEKSIVSGRTISTVQKLNEQERIEEIARLMSGELISPAAIENARSLMN